MNDNKIELVEITPDQQAKRLADKNLSPVENQIEQAYSDHNTPTSQNFINDWIDKNMTS